MGREGREQDHTAFKDLAVPVNQPTDARLQGQTAGNSRLEQRRHGLPTLILNNDHANNLWPITTDTSPESLHSFREAGSE